MGEGECMGVDYNGLIADTGKLARIYFLWKYARYRPIASIQLYQVYLWQLNHGTSRWKSITDVVVQQTQYLHPEDGSIPT